MKQILINKVAPLFLILIFMFSFTEDAEAQRRKRRTRDTDTRRENVDKAPFSDFLMYEIGIGNTSLFNGNFNIGIRPAVGYKVSSFLNVGINAKYIFNLFNIPFSDDISTHSYSVAAFVQGKITQSFYLKALYDYGRYQAAFSTQGGSIIEDEVTELSPLLGGGYTSGFGDWKWGFEILYVGNENVRDYHEQIEYWIVASYKF